MENTSLMGVKYPAVLQNAIEVLQKKAGEIEEEITSEKKENE
ncbi:MAG: phage holin family protein [Ruminococcus flavefaciens]|nr:phage holin family protein [Ruminococcus flavefaciens]